MVRLLVLVLAAAATKPLCHLTYDREPLQAIGILKKYVSALVAS